MRRLLLCGIDLAAGVNDIDQTVRAGAAEVVVNNMLSVADYPDAPKGAVAVVVRWPINNAASNTNPR
ncbi:hypothetical protein [Asticcacaulis sp. AC402]|uniref:hypothetical protein n=1 Tax=Asticcacaulis sp. AC402 TaxID=1282361 RepID=UPI0003C3B103|nr:hypothetical protein [Asticcacaulis sp. AC402]ESQ74114.1 hypothetical protein ABAC402_15805 [Asticcacaulis sp. AC402]